MLAAQTTLLHSQGAGFDSPAQKNPFRGVYQSIPPGTAAIRFGHQSRQLGCSLMDLRFLILPDFLLLCLELTVIVPEKKTSCFSNEVPGEAV